MKKNNKAFTLVELIVAITIIAILGTIAFISMQSYSANARDSTRVSDLSAMKTSLELFQLDAGKYPEPTDGFIISYSGSEVWTQGTFGKETLSNISKLDKVPTDPLTVKEYTYSVTKTRQEYQFAGIVEGDEVTQNINQPHPNPLLRGEGIDGILETNAGDLMATALVTGTYNGQMIKTENGTNCNILSLPSIISSEPNTVTDLSVILDNESLVYNGYKNLPTNYILSKYKSDGGFMFTSNKFVVYDDSASCTPLYNPEDNTARIELITNLQEAYSGTLIEDEDNINGVVNMDLTDTGSLDIISSTLVNNNLGGDLEISNTPSSGGGGGNNTVIPPLCTLTQVEIDTLNGYYISEEISVYDVLGNPVVGIDENAGIFNNLLFSKAHAGLIPGGGTGLLPLTENDWCNKVKELYWYGGSSIPSEVWKLINLTYLGLDNNFITSVSPEIGNLKNLTDLYFDNNSLTSIPAEIGNLNALINLGLSSNSFTSLPSSILSLTNLKTLRLSGNNFTTVPLEISSLTNLEELGLSTNSFTSLPPEIGALVNLTRLDLSENSLISLPPEIGNLINLNTLYLGYNSLTSLPPEIGNLINLTELNIYYNSLTSLPSEIGDLVNLISLNLNNNSLTSLPPEIGNLTNLLFLGLIYNSLTTLPPEIGNLVNLDTIDVVYNSLTSIPSEIGNLNIRFLRLDENSLTSIPSSVGNLTNLLTLSLSYNSITSIPSSVGNLTNLTSLNLNNNSLTNLPLEIKNLLNLDHILLYNNPLLGNLSYNFVLNSSTRSQLNIPSAGKTMSIRGNGTNIVITVTP